MVTIKPRETGEIGIEWSHVYPSTGTTSHTIRRDKRGKALPLIVFDNAYAAVSNIASIVTASPHIAIIIDKAMPLRPGADLMTIALGPTVQDHHRGHQGSSITTTGRDAVAVPVAAVTPDGCPISVETNDHVKLLAQIPKADITMHLNEFISFILAHFTDTDALTDYINTILSKVEVTAGGASNRSNFALTEISKKHVVLAKVSVCMHIYRHACWYINSNWICLFYLIVCSLCSLQRPYLSSLRFTSFLILKFLLLPFIAT